MDLDFTRIAERKIQEAIDEGKFDNLPGKGKPLNLDEDPFTPRHLRIANRILKNAGILPDWMQAEQEMEQERAEIHATFARLGKEYPRRRSRAEDRSLPTDPVKRIGEFGVWRAKVRAAYLSSLKRVNTDITKTCLIAPSVTRAHFPYNIAQEMARFDEAFPGLPGDQEDTVSANGPGPDQSSKLAAEARYRYRR